MLIGKYKYLLLNIASLVAIFVFWGYLTYGGFIKPFFLPTPTNVLHSLNLLFFDQGFAKDVAVSIVRILSGFILATIIGVPIGVLVGLNKKAESVIGPIMEFIRYTPIAAVIPLFILWFGIGELEKILVIAASVFFQLVIMVATSISFTPKEIIQSGESLGASRSQVITNIIFPYSKPRILDDLRISMGWAWSGLMIAEIVGSTSGIGFVIIQSQRLLQSSNVIASIIVVGVLGILTDLLFKTAYHHYFPWIKKVEKYA